MTDEEKKQLQALYNLKGASIVLSPEQAALLQELEDTFIADEIMPALGKHVLPLMKQLHGAFTLQVIQAEDGRQRAYFQRNEQQPEPAAPTPAMVADEPEPEPAPEPTDKRKRKRPNFRFSMVGIRPGEWITFIPTSLRVKVVSDNKVEYDGQQYKLSPFVVRFLPDDLRNRKNAYRGPKYFAYHGQRLDDLRPDTHKKKDGQ